MTILFHGINTVKIAKETHIFRFHDVGTNTMQKGDWGHFLNFKSSHFIAFKGLNQSGSSDLNG